MNINVTLFAQVLVFLGLVWVTMKYIWPVLMQAMETRRKTIADGLAAAEEGRRRLASADEESRQRVQEGRGKADELIARAHREAARIVDEAKQAAAAEGQRIVAAAHSDAEREKARARGELSREVARLAVAGAEQILDREVDARTHARMLDELGAQLGHTPDTGA